MNKSSLNLEIKIRPELSSDFEAVEFLIINAFKDAEHSDGDEHNLVRRLRDSNKYINELALVALVNNQIAGHILFTPICIRTDDGRLKNSLALAPVSVLLEFQGLGIGAALINEGHKVSKKLGYSSIVVLGHPDYYPKFGYVQTTKWKIRAPFDVPSEAFMAVELVGGALGSAVGVVEYPPEFGISP